MTRAVFILIAAAWLLSLLTACGGDPEPSQYGPDPQLPETAARAFSRR